jgi:hypothetical protein
MSENAERLLTRGLVIDEPWISLILSGKKTWEMRSTGTRKREPIGLIRKGSKQVVGIADLVDSLPALSREDYARTEAFHRIPLGLQSAAILRRRVRPWVLAAARSLPTPIPYKHGSGPVIWIKLDATVIAAIHAN